MIRREKKKREINAKMNRSALNLIVIYFFNQKWVKKKRIQRTHYLNQSNFENKRRSKTKPMG